ncbi:cyclic nucleotide-binding domain protein (macronuclear) [Tetrahymena thermophila SB210]|uniref:Cyclic nucleotide-binding domain protein n=1 Tax=Tetrahymena thermophila (strain SB210) TaxID=312017 RepID=I7LWT4_TETTS|nr:cyclic nucleotide-binding domain protein [Tetrahymena thermophila SB210]EAS02812.2 cyclic nucleotide-binding domain protein [Tetrahymena thermophila SB210]|eukprot:XP_001023057.2 cyclic nucleotide-binding domain protein [Tetrahymena thermophila SB210]
MEYQDDNNDIIDEENQECENKQQTPPTTDKKIQIFNDQIINYEMLSKRSVITKTDKVALKKQSILIINNPILNINNWDPQKTKNIIQSKIIDFRERDVSMIAINILTRPVKTKQEKNFLMKGIQGLQLFQEYKDIFSEDQMNHQLFKEIQLKCFKKNEVIFNIGDHGSTYFIILLGSVFCLLREATQQQPQGDSYQNENAHSNDPKTISQDINNIKRMKSREVLPQVNKKQSAKDASVYTEEEQEDLYQIKKIYPNLECVKIYKAGEAFGEISLMTNSSRTATMVCREDTYLMTLNKQGFEKIVGAYHEYIVRERLAFLQRFSFFKEIHPSKLLSILLFMNIEKFEQKNVIYKQGDDIDYVYFIKSGEIELFTNICLDSLAQDEENNKSFSPKKQIKYNIVDQNKISKKLKKKIPISILGPNNLFGEEEIQLNINKRKCEAIVYSIEATLFIIRKDTIQNRSKFTSERQSMMIQTLDLEQKAKILIKQNIETENMLNKLKMESKNLTNENVLPLQDQDEDQDFSQSNKIKTKESESLSPSQKQQPKNKLNNGQFTPRKSVLQHIRGFIDSPTSKTQNNQIDSFDYFQQCIDSQQRYSICQSPRLNNSKEQSVQYNSIFHNSGQSQSPRLNDSKEFVKQQNSIFHQDQKYATNQFIIENQKRRSTTNSLVNKSKNNENIYIQPYELDTLQVVNISPRGKKAIHQSRKISPEKPSTIAAVNDQPEVNAFSNQIKWQNNQMQPLSEDRNYLTSKKQTIPNLDSNNYYTRRESDQKVFQLLEKNGLLGNQIEELQSKQNFNENLLKYIEDKNPNSSKKHNIFNIVSNEIESQAKQKNGIITNPFNIFSISDEQIQQRFNAINSSSQIYPKSDKTSSVLQNGSSKNNLSHLRQKYQLIKQKFFNRDLSSYCSNTQNGLSCNQITEVSNNTQKQLKNKSYLFNNLQKIDSNQLINGGSNQKNSLKNYLKHLDKYEDKRGKTSNKIQKQNTSQLEEIMLSSINQSFTDTMNSQKTQNKKGVDIIVETNLDLEKPSFIEYNTGELAMNKQGEDLIFQNNSDISDIALNTHDQIQNQHQEDTKLNENETNLSRQSTEKPNNFQRRASQEDMKLKLKKQQLILPLSKITKNDEENYIFQSFTQRNILGSQKQSTPDFSQPLSIRDSGLQNQIYYLKQYSLLNKLACKKNQSSNATKQNISTERIIPQQQQIESLVMSSTIKFEILSKKNTQNKYKADEIIQKLKKENNNTLPSIHQTESNINPAFNNSLVPTIQPNQSKIQISQSQSTSSAINVQTINKQNKNLNTSKNNPKQQMYTQGMNIHYTTKKAKNDFFSQIFKSSEASRQHLLNQNYEITDTKQSIFDQSQGINIYGLQSNPVKLVSSQKQNSNQPLK